MTTVMAMMKTTPAADDPIIRGSFSWILELYSSKEQEKTKDTEWHLCRENAQFESMLLTKHPTLCSHFSDTTCKPGSQENFYPTVLELAAITVLLH